VFHVAGFARRSLSGGGLQVRPEVQPQLCQPYCNLSFLQDNFSHIYIPVLKIFLLRGNAEQN